MSYDLKELQRLEKAIGPLPYGTERSVANRDHTAMRPGIEAPAVKP